MDALTDKGAETMRFVFTIFITSHFRAFIINPLKSMHVNYVIYLHRKFASVH